MEQQMYKVQIDGEERSFPAGTTYLQIAGEYQERYPHDIVLVYVNGKLQELGKKLKKDCTLHFVTTGETIGNLTYRRGVSFLLVKAVYDTIGHDKIEQVRIHFSVDKGYYCTIKGDQKLDQELLARIEERMHEMADMDLSIRKRSVHTDEAVEMFRKYGMKDKERLFRYRRVSTVNIYSINEFEDYYYGYMVPSTGYLKYFKLYLYDEGFVVQMPEAAEPEKIPPFQPQNKLFHVLKESTRGGDMLGIETVGALNDYVTGGSANPKELLLVQEAMQEKYQKILEKLDEIDQILNDYSRGWKTSRMSRVDLTALRLAVYEMKFDEDVPVGVAINEAVELAKMFGGDDSGSFVNGILGKIASGKKDSGEAPKRRRPTHQAKIIIRSSKKDAPKSETKAEPEENSDN